MLIREDYQKVFLKDFYKLELKREKLTDTVHEKLYAVKTNISGAGDKMSDVLPLGGFKRHTSEGENIDYVAPTSGDDKLVRYHTYSAGTVVSYETQQDSIKLKNLIKLLSGSWGESAQDEYEYFAALPFNEGGTTAGHWVFDGTHTGNTDASGKLLYDDVCFLNLAGNPRYKNGVATAFYNSVAGLTLSPSTFKQMFILMTATNRVTELGRPKPNKPDTLLTQEGADSETAWILLNTYGPNNSKPGGATNDRSAYTNKEDSWVGKINHIDWAYLDDTSNPFYLLKAKKNMELHKRQLPEVEFHRNPVNKAYLADIILRMGSWILGWDQIVRGGGTST